METQPIIIAGIRQDNEGAKVSASILSAKETLSSFSREDQI